MYKTLIYIIASIVVCGCSSNFKPVEISKYKISTDLIENKETVNIIYSPGYPNYKKSEFYINCIVVTNLNDTFNVLADPVWDIASNRNKLFLKEGSTEFKLMKKTSKKVDPFDLKNVNIERAPIVLVNKNYPEVESNNFPTVVGLLVNEMKDLN